MKSNKTQEQSMMHFFLFDPNIYPAMLVTLRGELTAEQIETAVKKAYTRNETTMSKVVLEKGEAYFQVLPETGCKVTIDSRDWREIMHQSEKDTFKINEGELMRCYILPQENEFKLFVMAHHIVGDGTALVFFVQDVLNCLDGRDTEYRALNLEGSLGLPPKAKFPMKSKIGLKLLNKQWKKTGKPFTWEDYYHIHREFWKNRKNHVEIKEIEKEELAAIKEKCKALGITINSYILADVLREKPSRKLIGCPVSIRGTNRSINNQVMTLKFPHEYVTELSFEENAKKVHQTIAEQLEDDGKKSYISLATRLLEPSLLDGALMATYTEYNNPTAEKIAQLWGFAGDQKVDMGITNLKEVEIDTEYAGFTLESLCCIAATMSSTKEAVCVCTLKDKMTLCYCNIETL